MNRSHSPAPSSTYRLQLSKDTTFGDAAGLLPYLDALGVGALYASPLLESGAGSNHGYDVVDPTRVSAERGGEDGRRALVGAVREHGLGFVLDIVPNHVGVDIPKANPWWWDVLAHGRASEHAATSTSTGPPDHSSCPSSTPTRRRRSPSLPSPTTAHSCATTSTPSRWPPAPATPAPRRRCTSASTTASYPGSAAPPS